MATRRGQVKLLACSVARTFVRPGLLLAHPLMWMSLFLHEKRRVLLVLFGLVDRDFVSGECVVGNNFRPLQTRNGRIIRQSEREK